MNTLYKIETVTLLVADRPTRNGTIYPLNEIKKALFYNSTKLDTHLYGTIIETAAICMDEYDRLDINNFLDRVSHYVDNLSTDDNTLRGDITILDTPMGHKLKDYIDDNTHSKICFAPSSVGQTFTDENNDCIMHDFNFVSVNAFTDESDESDD